MKALHSLLKISCKIVKIFATWRVESYVALFPEDRSHSKKCTHRSVHSTRKQPFHCLRLFDSSVRTFRLWFWAPLIVMMLTSVASYWTVLCASLICPALLNPVNILLRAVL